MPREALWIPRNDRLKVYVSVLVLGGVLAIGAFALLFIGTFLYPPGDIRTYAGNVDQFDVGVPVTFVSDEFHLVKQEDGSFIALYARDTYYKRCSVEWRDQFRFNGTEGWFYALCTGSIFDVHGMRVFGPSPRSLDRFPVEIEDKKVYVTAIEAKLIRGCTRHQTAC